MERRVSTRLVFEGRIMTVRVDTVMTDSGRTTVREVVERPEVVSVLPIDARKNVLLVRQFRYTVGREVLEIPAGVVAHGEDIREAARRELREETGYDCRDLRILISYRPAIGYSTERMTVFLAKELVYAPEKGDEESIAVERLPFDDVYKMVVGGRSPFEDGKSVVAVLVARALGEA